MYLRAFSTVLLLASLCFAQQKPGEAEKPLRATDEGGKPKTQFAQTEFVLLEFHNPGPEAVECLTGVQPELMPNEGFSLERWTGNRWETALRPFEARSYKASVKAGERLVRRWPASWGEPGRYRATLVCGQTAFEPVEFEVGGGGSSKGAPAEAGKKQADVFAVTEAVLRPEESKVSGQCPATVKFTGHITTNGPGTVTYTFTLSDGGTASVSTLEFKQAGTQTVTTTWTLGGAALPTYEGWVALKVLTPNEVESSREAGRFLMSCNPAAGW